jgi:hypothetical protein
MRSRWFRITLRTCLIGLAIGVVGFVITTYLAISEMCYNIYVPVGAVDLVVEHMKAHNGAWPKNWDELHETFVAVQDENGYFRGFRWEEYPNRVGIDFAADPAKLATAAEVKLGERPFRAIWSLANPDALGPRSIEPNRVLLYHLKSQKEDAGARQSSRGDAH